MGFKIINISSIFLAIVFMILIAIMFLGMGLVFASKMRDIQGFSIVMNFVSLYRIGFIFYFHDIKKGTVPEWRLSPFLL